MRRIVLDFDGVIHSYPNGWKGYDVIDGEPVPGVLEAMLKLKDNGYQVAILTSRALEPAGLAAIRAWLTKHGVDPDADIETITAAKLPAMVYFDDRAVRFEPGLDIVGTVENFTPWMMDRPIRSALE